MCNAWNHSLDCTCGWGGEGHLGRNTSGNGGYGGLKSFFSTARSRKIGTYDSFLTANAKCPVCGKAVFFYQSEFGGRVFFESLGWPWPKHPCTDSGLQGESKVSIELLGEDEDHYIVSLIAKFDVEGYFPLVCSRSKGLRELRADFMYPENSNRKNASVWLRLNSSLRITVGSIFFIKEISAAEGSYRLRLCYSYREAGHQKISFEYVDAEIGAFIRPVLKRGRIEFKDFTGHNTKSIRENKDAKIRIKKKTDIRSNQTRNPASASPQNRQFESRCKFCEKSIPDNLHEKHRTACANERVACPKCEKIMERHNIPLHLKNHCPKRRI